MIGALNPLFLAASLAIGAPATAPSSAFLSTGRTTIETSQAARPQQSVPSTLRSASGRTLRVVRTRAERVLPDLPETCRLHTQMSRGRIVPPPPVTLRHPKTNPSSSRDPALLG